RQRLDATAWREGPLLRDGGAGTRRQAGPDPEEDGDGLQDGRPHRPAGQRNRKLEVLEEGSGAAQRSLSGRRPVARPGSRRRHEPQPDPARPLGLGEEVLHYDEGPGPQPGVLSVSADPAG